MPGDYSNSNHTAEWFDDPATQGSEIILEETLIVLQDSDDWLFDGDFTVECFGVKFSTVSSERPIITQWQPAAGGRSWRIDWNQGTPNLLRAFISSDGSASTMLSEEFTPTVDQAYDFAIDRSGSTFRLYRDGSMVDSASHAGSLHNSPARLIIGGQENPAGSIDSIRIDGRIKAVRITKGTARYADDGGYTVPDLPLPTEGPA